MPEASFQNAIAAAAKPGDLQRIITSKKNLLYGRPDFPRRLESRPIKLASLNGNRQKRDRICPAISSRLSQCPPLKKEKKWRNAGSRSDITKRISRKQVRNP
ncbi:MULTISPECIES: hypothetical protein [unclassified Herbaspirillum]|uniref:hypothetical protein n=1 Tax=unclassified Herbaspirillum TaxID=2624150 RepID=UPI0011522C36|nr:MULTISPECIES: hypothetical protein [unclassified Herbaspirillum]MBB5390564.1 hypothetical protein [Herbaspirillum sp. SJZ102]